MSQLNSHFGRATRTICCSSPSKPGTLFGRPLKQGLRCRGGADFGAVDKIHKAVADTLGRQSAEAPRPSVEGIPVITGGLALGTAPQASIDEIAGQFFKSRVMIVIDERYRHLMSVQQSRKSR